MAEKPSKINPRRPKTENWVSSKNANFVAKKKSVIIFNPPYDVRIRIDKDLSKYYTNLGEKLKNQCTDCIIHIFTVNNEYLDLIDIPCVSTKEIKNANLECVLNTYQT